MKYNINLLEEFLDNIFSSYKKYPADTSYEQGYLDAIKTVKKICDEMKEKT